MDRFYKVNEVDDLRFYKVPKLLFSNEKYINLGLGEKMVYGILQDRFELSIKNNWIDEDNNIYLVFDGEALGNLLQVHRKTARKYIKELEKAGLLIDKRMGVNKANRIYILKPELNDIDYYKKKTKEIKPETDPVPIDKPRMALFVPSGCDKKCHQDGTKSATNDTDFSDTDFSDTKSVSHKKNTDETRQENKKLTKILETVKIYEMSEQELLKKAITELWHNKFIKLKNRVDSQDVIRENLMKLDLEIIDTTLFKFSNAKKEGNIRSNGLSYFIKILYSQIDEIFADRVF